MKDRAVALRYARALEAALDGDVEIVRTADELAALARAMEADPVVAEALVNPGIDAKAKRALVDTVAERASLSEKSAAFLRILAEHGRLDLVPQTARLIAGMRDKRLGVVEAEVTTATPLTPDLTDKMKQTLEKTTGRKVRLALKTDPAILGGMVARVGSMVYDGSLRTRLSALRTHIARN